MTVNKTMKVQKIETNEELNMICFFKSHPTLFFKSFNVGCIDLPCFSGIYTVE